MSDAQSARFFVYGTARHGEPNHAALVAAGARPVKSAGEVSRTAAGYSLVEVGPFAALVEEGAGVVVGEVYELARAGFFPLLRALDPRGIFQLGRVRLEDGTTVESLVLAVDQARGKRRIRGGDWRARFQPLPRQPGLRNAPPVRRG
ncbi:MAG: gamma-glutamylcyclotransferase family protein [Polyangiaceae bacterium]